MAISARILEPYHVDQTANHLLLQKQTVWQLPTLEHRFPIELIKQAKLRLDSY